MFLCITAKDEDDKQATAEAVSEDHPEVQQMIREAVKQVEDNPPDVQGEMYVEAIEDNLKLLECQRKEENPEAP